MIAECIRNQLRQDSEDDQSTIKEYENPFTGAPVNGGK